MNDFLIFVLLSDTSERVVGFSFFVGKDLKHSSHRVIVMGNTKWFYRKRFHSDLLYYVFDKENGDFEPLTSIYKREWMGPGDIKYKNHMINPLGAVNHFCTISDTLQYCPPVIVMKKIAEDPTPVKTLDALGFLDPIDFFISETDPEPTNDNSAFPSFWAAVINNNEYYSSRHGGHLFYEQLSLPNEERNDIGQTPFKKVFGIYTMGEVLYVVAVKKDECCQIKVFQISDNRDDQAGTFFEPHWEYIKVYIINDFITLTKFIH